MRPHTHTHTHAHTRAHTIIVIASGPDCVEVSAELESVRAELEVC
jgi:hypothetical protein